MLIRIIDEDCSGIIKRDGNNKLIFLEYYNSL